MEGTPTYDFAKNSEKMQEIWKFLIRWAPDPPMNTYQLLCFNEYSLGYFYRPKLCLGQGNIFTPVLSLCPQGGGGLPWTETPLQRDPCTETPLQRDPRTDTPLYGKERAVRILLECSLV